jgi:putative phosphoesterase
VEIAIISDTHMPRGGRVLPAACVTRLVRADLILHAGDFTRWSVLEEIERHGQVLAVHGNVDDEDLRSALPASRVVDVGGPRVGLVHDAGPARGRLERLRAMFPDADAVVFGHSHMALHERSGDGFQIFNPGSPTERRRAPRHTMGIARIRGGALSFELAALG